jgi:hypothetical protein
MSKSQDKIAVLTIGRWQPPHVGHDPLISGTIQLARKLGGIPLLWISPSQDEVFSVAERTDTDPLSVFQRIYYLNKMYPRSKYPNLTFLTDVRGGIGIRYEEQLKTGISSGLTTRGKTVPSNWGNMTTCNKYKYMSILKEKNKANGNRFSLSERCMYLSNRNAGVIAGEIPLPSKQCLIGLKKKKYTHVTLLVGSDRVAAFKKYNDELGNRLFEDKYETKLEGLERGFGGQRSIQLELDGGKEERELKNAMDAFYEIPETKEALAKKYSGTRTRNFANTRNVVDFIESVKKGEMTIMDCYCLMNDIRNKGQRVGHLKPVTEKEFMEQLSVAGLSKYKKNFVETKESVDKWALDNAKRIEDKKFRPLEPNVMRRRKPNMIPDTIATTRSTIATTGPTRKLKLDGGTRKRKHRKTRKHKKRKKRKHKKRKTKKHRKRNYKKRRARKTRKNKN